jgi:hypothetical protein
LTSTVLPARKLVPMVALLVKLLPPTLTLPVTATIWPTGASLALATPAEATRMDREVIAKRSFMVVPLVTG